MKKMRETTAVRKKKKKRRYLQLLLIIKDVRKKIFCSIGFFKLLLWTDNDLLVLEMNIKIGGHRLRFKDKACEKLV